MKIQFNPHQGYQEDAISSVTDLFKGQPKGSSSLTRSLLSLPAEDSMLIDTPEYLGVHGNNLLLSDATILKNLQDIQNRNAVELSQELDEGLQFDIEMETGTGKTYVYLRTAFELARTYGFMKYIILVPSVAIREGVRTSLSLMAEHFRELYPDIQSDVTVYSGDRSEEVRGFATATSLQFMIMTIDSLRGDKNTRVMHQKRDRLSGLRPLDYLRSTHPIVIIDEPQNMETQLAQSAIQDLSPLCMLRYSATHRVLRNLVYRLDPIDAHQLGLVKQIVIADAVQEGETTQPYVRLVEIKRDPLAARIEILARKKDGKIAKKTVTAKQGADLEVLSGGNETYADNWRISEISADPEYVELSHHGKISLDEQIGGQQRALFKEMIRETIREHFRREELLHSRHVKVLSLFFIDHVASYLGDGSNNLDADGQFAVWFDEIYREERAQRHLLAHLPENPVEARSGYFAQMTKGRGAQKVTTFKDSSGTTKADDDAYELIMKDKERLLSEDEPVRFIFSHSALREGWDNPNVFQICTLRDMSSETERRQTIGRGLRLPVDSEGHRVHDRSLAQLTVIANESYAQFAKALQEEYQNAGIAIGFVRTTEFAKLHFAHPDDHSDTTQALGVERSQEIWDTLHDQGYLDDDGRVTPQFEPRTPDFELELPAMYDSLRTSIIDIVMNCYVERIIKQKRKRKVRTLNRNLYITPEFEDFWEKISQRTTYHVSFDQEKVIQNCVKAIQDAPAIEPIRIVVTRTGMTLERGGTRDSVKGERIAEVKESYTLPDIISELQKDTSLTRRSIVRILQESGRLKDFLANPTEFMTMVKKRIQEELYRVIVDGIQYEPLGGSVYELRELKADGKLIKEYFEDNLYKVQNPEKTDFDYILLDSEVERQFARFLDTREDISLFMKLPEKFHIPTPVGNYNPDWAIVKKDDDGIERLYMIRETKGTNDLSMLRPSEAAKIKAARQHFKALDVDYKVSEPQKWEV
ncbi:restriction endonuclease [Alloscardovia macacae]|uniref:Restriction endonuclease n=1 Tax=Alloscardovia macacae TaxID=1160091 RepID=A0A261F433_9BIFI|nr:DEAD/DEAH box helicase family protein [Alloscardovia macacae]OZG53858.1 restriction endonuclease [Alloscardovia macacae]